MAGLFTREAIGKPFEGSGASRLLGVVVLNMVREMGRAKILKRPTPIRKVSCQNRPLGSVVPGPFSVSHCFSPKRETQRENSLDKTLADVTKFSCYTVLRLAA